MPLKDLPTEIWINIARHFYGTHTNDLNAQEDLLHKWPRKYQNIAREVIFEHPIVRTSEVCRFLRGYIQYPSLRERTTEMSIVFDRRHGRPLSCFEHRVFKPSASGSEDGRSSGILKLEPLEIIQEKINNFEDRDGIVHELERGFLRAYVCLLLLMPTNLKRLNFVAAGPERWRYEIFLENITIMGALNPDWPVEEAGFSRHESRPGTSDQRYADEVLARIAPKVECLEFRGHMQLKICPFVTYNPPLGTLQPFTNLRRLVVPSHALSAEPAFNLSTFQVDQFPAKLEVLEIVLVENRTAMIRWLEYLLNSGAKPLALREIVVCLSHTPRNFSRLRLLANERDVALYCRKGRSCYVCGPLSKMPR